MKLGCSGVVWNQGRLLLGRKCYVDEEDRGFSGQWMTPGGGVELNESVQQAVYREVMEECSVPVVVGQLIHTTTIKPCHILFYRCEHFGKISNVKGGDDFSEARFFTREEFRALRQVEQVSVATREMLRWRYPEFATGV